MGKNLIERHDSKTPKWWKRIGTAINTLGTMMTGYAVLNDHPTWALVSLLLTWAGKTITDFATEEEKKSE